MSLFRRFMDCKPITIYKKGLEHNIDPNTAVIAGCNPTEDFFIEETAFRPQLPFKEGILSRYDTIIPLTSTPIKNKMVSDQMDLFGYTQEPIDLLAIKSRLSTISTGMNQINRVIISPEQQDHLKQVFQMHNERDMRKPMFKTRPLMILRDLENLSRLVNVIASVNFSKRKIDEGGLLTAADEDIERACQLWENLIELRIQLYQDEGNRNIVTVGDEILIYMLNQTKNYPDNKVPISVIRNRFVNELGSVSDASFYRELEALRKDRKVLQTGRRDGKLELVVR
jgi:DNA replicative helicase MCM subunit Mcm2 (Cdc46/Mcm family)